MNFHSNSVTPTFSLTLTLNLSYKLLLYSYTVLLFVHIVYHIAFLVRTHCFIHTPCFSHSYTLLLMLQDLAFHTNTPCFSCSHTLCIIRTPCFSYSYPCFLCFRASFFKSVCLVSCFSFHTNTPSFSIHTRHLLSPKFLHLAFPAPTQPLSPGACASYPPVMSLLLMHWNTHWHRWLVSVTG